MAVAYCTTTSVERVDFGEVLDGVSSEEINSLEGTERDIKSAAPTKEVIFRLQV